MREKERGGEEKYRVNKIVCALEREGKEWIG